MNDPRSPNSGPLKKTDYYLNKDGLMVFTESYLRSRGFCCQSGCQHCPYPKKISKLKKKKISVD